ncbi:hypothetical protein NBRC116597_38120 [Phaeobacter sp. NW0010-22]
MLKIFPLVACAALVLTACQPSVSGNASFGISTSAGSLPPPPGRTAAERRASKDYYRGPRGDEF